MRTRAQSRRDGCEPGSGALAGGRAASGAPDPARRPSVTPPSPRSRHQRVTVDVSGAKTAKQRGLPPAAAHGNPGVADRAEGHCPPEKGASHPPGQPPDRGWLHQWLGENTSPAEGGSGNPLGTTGVSSRSHVLSSLEPVSSDNSPVCRARLPSSPMQPERRRGRSCGHWGRRRCTRSGGSGRRSARGVRSRCGLRTGCFAGSRSWRSCIGNRRRGVGAQ